VEPETSGISLGEILTTLRQLEASARADLAAELQKRQEELDHDLALAEKVHHSLIPRSLHGEDLQVAVRYRPMRGVGGDLLSLLEGSAGHHTICIADVTGHGVAAALLAARIASHLGRLVERDAPPAEVLNGLNDFLHAHFNHTGLYLTAMVAKFDTDAGLLHVAGAGHPPALLWRRRTGVVESIGSQYTLLGVLPQLLGDGPAQTAVERGDRLLIYTDGITEARSRSGAFLGTGGLERVMRGTAGEDVEGVADAILATTAGFRRGDPEDDMLVCVAELA
jgi:sigma-B regulation protein RsbU (phosphoserine phosphatase)